LSLNQSVDFLSPLDRLLLLPLVETALNGHQLRKYLFTILFGQSLSLFVTRSLIVGALTRGKNYFLQPVFNVISCPVSEPDVRVFLRRIDVQVWRKGIKLFGLFSSSVLFYLLRRLRLFGFPLY
jgi:hypothetical protein